MINNKEGYLEIFKWPSYFKIQKYEECWFKNNKPS